MNIGLASHKRDFMKIGNLLVAVFFCMITLLTGCATPHHPQVNQNLLQENWMRTINLNPMIWTQSGDRWFFTGEPNNVPTDNALSLTTVKVSQFTNININGCFQVQITGSQAQNSVSILGPNDGVRQVMVQTSRDTVVITQAQDDKGHMTYLKNVIVRIGVRNLKHLKITGAANVEGRMLVSDGLVINANNSGNILLSGNVNVVTVNNGGPGPLSILGAYTPCLSVTNSGSGSVNISGRVGIQAISNLRAGRVNIIGADSRSLAINACGNSITTVAGYVNLKRLNAIGNSCVHIYWVNSNGAHVALSGNARVGLAGTVTNLDLSATGNARFGGQYLHTNNIYVQTLNNSHANISARQKIFASASDDSSIYYFGSTNIVSRYSSDHAIVIPVWSGTTLPVPAYAPQFITSVNRPPVQNHRR